jgi:uncharacterized membrane protein YhaH (DUF805 family)
MDQTSNNPYKYRLDAITEHYFDYTGTSSRKEVWMFLLSAVICGLALGFVWLNLYILTGGGKVADIVVGILCYLMMFFLFTLPYIALTVRRIRDIGWSPWLILLYLVIPVNLIAFFVFACTPGRNNR